MQLSILMPALESRPWKEMTRSVENQIDRCGASDFVELLVDVDDGADTSGTKRQRLLESSRGEYVCFIDDDDQLASNYVDWILRAVLSGADVLTFNLRMIRTDRPGEEIWKFGLHPNLRKHGLMCVNHLCAWKREIARRVAWCPQLGMGDDHLWFEPLFHSGQVTTQYHINRVLYQYVYSPTVTVNQRRDVAQRSRQYMGRGIPCYLDAEGEIWIGTSGRCHISGGLVEVRNRDNRVETLLLSELNHFHTVR